jgi:hypothetical protein
MQNSKSSLVRRSRNIRRSLACAFLLATVWTPWAGFQFAGAQEPFDWGQVRIDRQQKSAIIDSLSRSLEENYIFLDVARDIGNRFRRQLKQKTYDTLLTLEAFTEALMRDMREISHDLHMGVRASAPRRPDSEDSAAALQRRLAWQAEMRRENYGFRRVEILPGNVGYVDLRGFMPAEFGGGTAVAAMNFLASADVIVFDLRSNGGGHPSMIQLISIYLLREPTHLNSFYIRRSDSTEQFWTAAWVEGPRLPDVPVYVLTSRRTFSAAEEFTYNLKNLKRATIVGDTTGGGAHPVDEHWFRIDDSVFVEARIPYGRAVNPITGTNWEGTGVAPDIAVPADQALDAARLDFITKRLEKESDEQARFALTWAQSELRARMNPVTLDDAKASAFAGTYGPRLITLENGELYYQREDRPKYRMIPMGDDLFALDGLEYFRVQFVRDASGAVVELTGLYDNGMRDANQRSSDR